MMALIKSGHTPARGRATSQRPPATPLISGTPPNSELPPQPQRPTKSVLPSITFAIDDDFEVSTSAECLI